MGYFESDAQEMLDIFLQETRQLNGRLEEILLESESKGRFAEEDIHSIFRAMHTIKSSAAMMGLGGLSSLSHTLEDLFSFYREHSQRLEAPDPSLFDLLFAATDFIKQELNQMNQADYVPGDTSLLEEQARAYLKEISGGAAGEDVPDAAETAETADAIDAAETADAADEPLVPEIFASKGGTVVNVTLEGGCRMENIRAFMLVRSIIPLCTLVETYPENLERPGKSADYIGSHGVFIRFESNDKARVLELLTRGLFVERCRVVADNPPQSPGSLPGDEDNSSQDPGNRNEKREPEDTDGEFMEIRTERLDFLQNLAAELLLQTQLLEEELKQRGMEDIEDSVGHQIGLAAGRIEHSVMQMRLVPVSRIVPKLRRTLRDICRDQKKEAELVVNCAEVEADRSVVDYVSDALLHIVRNAVDHGIEMPEERQAAGKGRQGRVTFTAENTAGELLLTVSDDGKGIDEDKVRKRAREKGLFKKPEEEYDSQQLKEFILYPGFSTNETVTGYSGRGVGMDVVKNIIEEVGGNLYIKSTKGMGSTFSIAVPLNLASMECVRFKVGDCRFSIPARHVYRFMEYESSRELIRQVNERDYILYDERLVPLIDLRRLYSLSGETPKRAILVYVKGAVREGCFLMDSIYEQKRIVVKKLSPLLGAGFRRRTGICGCSIMGSGHICAALDTEEIVGLYEWEGIYDR